MTPEAALIELLERMGAEQDAIVLVTTHELNNWPSQAVAAMKSQKLLAKARPANSVVCPGCEQDCLMPVNTLPQQFRRIRVVHCLRQAQRYQPRAYFP